MGDPFSIGLGVLSVIQASASVAKGVYEFVDTVKNAKNEVPLLARDVMDFYRNVKRLEAVLQEPAIVRYVERHEEVDEDLELLKDPLERCNSQMKKLMKELRENTESYTNAIGTWREVKSFRWYFVKPGVLKTREDLGYAESRLSNTLQTLDYVQTLRDRAKKDALPVPGPAPPRSPSPQPPSAIEQIQKEANKQARLLRQAAQNNDERTVQLVLDAGAAIDARNRDGRTALSWAAQYGSTTVARLLIKRSDNPKASANNVQNLVEGGHAKKAESNRTPLHWAAWAGHNEIVGMLLDAGADLEAKTKNHRTPLLEAALAHQIDTAQYLLSRGAKVNARTYYGWTMLHSAASHGDIDLANLALDNKADTSYEYTGGWHGEGKGKNRGLRQVPLHYAAWPAHKPTGDETAMLRLLVRKGQAYVKPTDSAGAQPIHYAVRLGWYAGTEELLKLGANPAAKDSVGDTPLHEAVKRGELKLVKLLLEYYPPKSRLSKNHESQTALTIAREKNLPAIAKNLQAFVDARDN